MGSIKSKNVTTVDKTMSYNIEREILHHKLKNDLVNIKGIKELNCDNFKLLFSDNSYFSKYLKKWLCKLSYKKKINEEIYFMGIEVFLLTYNNRSIKHFNTNISYLEIIICIVLNINPSELGNSIKLSKIKKIFKFLFNIFISDRDLKSEDIITSLCNTIYSEYSINIYKDIDANELKNIETNIIKIKDIFGNILNNLFFIKQEIEYKVNIRKYPVLPILNKNYLIMNKEILLMLGLHNNKIINNENLDRLFYANNNDFNFIKFGTSITNINKPIILLLKINNFYELKNQKGIIGAYIPTNIKEVVGFSGNYNCYLFQLYPKVKFFSQNQSKMQENYIHFNLKGDIPGLGFGYNEEKEKFRLWIDKNIENSYCISKDGTYQQGCLTVKCDIHINIETVEVFSLANYESQKHNLSESKRINLSKSVRVIRNKL